MNLLLIAPSSGKWRQVGRSKVANGKTFRFSLLSLLSVAAATPPDVNIKIIDEQCEDVPWDADVDLVGITCMTALAPRAYEIASRFRARGVPVVLGGMHPTFRWVEALEHADAVVAGEAEGVWRQVIDDARNGIMSGKYQAQETFDLSEINLPPYQLLNLNRYSTYAVQATRGCDRTCSFCSISAFHQHTQRRRPVESIIEEVKRIPNRMFLLVDDNLTADRDYAAQLFEALIPLKKYWVTQSTLAIADDPDFLQLAARAGCTGLFVGLETFTESNLQSVDKGFNHVEQYREAVRRFHANGIGVEAGIVLGFEHDDPSVFAHTLKMLDYLKIDAIQASIFTPLPGTLAYETMKPRLLDRNWGHYDFHHVVYQPQNMTPEAL
ncbi:B12-binding domain-containing radical SAM protein, partial [bacterium]|nr:B12-binding domain-containing radical SAM protein [bacterium]